MLAQLKDGKMVAQLLGAVFLLVGVLGFVPNPLVSPTGFFAVNIQHNFVHIISGLILLTGAQFGRGSVTLIGVGALYTVVAILGFLDTGPMLMGHIMMNEADRWLHVGLAAVLLAAGFYTKGKIA